MFCIMTSDDVINVRIVANGLDQTIEFASTDITQTNKNPFQNWALSYFKLTQSKENMS